MNKKANSIRDVDGVEIISVMDNSIDFLSTVKKKGIRKVREWTKDQMGEKNQV